VEVSESLDLMEQRKCQLVTWGEEGEGETQYIIIMVDLLAKMSVCRSLVLA